MLFQCSSASRKFLNSRDEVKRAYLDLVSVLFSEPKIPQYARGLVEKGETTSFSALQRAENSSMLSTSGASSCSSTFQCSSASRKFLNAVGRYRRINRRRSFSALQRAENSSIAYPNVVVLKSPKFQCSSASRKFLNASGFFEVVAIFSFSALQRAENSSIAARRSLRRSRRGVSVLFSEPKIPQLKHIPGDGLEYNKVSVLFSEPKIPQFDHGAVGIQHQPAFQCSSASRKFLNNIS